MTNSILTAENTTKAFSDTNISDWSTSFETLLTQKPTLLQYIGTGSNLTSYVHKWHEMQIGPILYNITKVNSQTSIEVDDNTSMVAGMILRFTKSNGNGKDGRAVVTEVNADGKTITIAVYKSMAIDTLIVGDVARVIANPQPEFSEGKSGSLYKTKTVENYTQIFERTISMSRTLMQSTTTDKLNYIQTQLTYKLDEIYREILETVIFGIGNDSSDDKVRTMKGLLELMKNSAVLAGGNTIDKVLNTALKTLNANGSSTENYLLVCHPDVAQKISALRTNTSGQIINVSPTDTTVGGSIQKFLSDTGNNAGIIQTWDAMPNDQLLILDPGYIKMQFLQSPISYQLPKVADGEVHRILTELTIEAVNASERNILVKGL